MVTVGFEPLQRHCLETRLCLPCTGPPLLHRVDARSDELAEPVPFLPSVRELDIGINAEAHGPPLAIQAEVEAPPSSAVRLHQEIQASLVRHPIRPVSTLRLTNRCVR